MFCSSSRRSPRPRTLAISGAVACLAMTILLLVVAGCASTDSDQPWNNPQPWEGSPMIPGMTAPP